MAGEMRLELENFLLNAPHPTSAHHSQVLFLGLVLKQRNPQLTSG